MVVALGSCRDDNELKPMAEYRTIAFSTGMAEEELVSRAATIPMTHDFTVYGYKNEEGIEQVVFDGYVVKYKEGSANTSEDNTHGYYYVGGNQTIKYWDFKASEYHFLGFYACPEDLATYDASGTSDILTLNMHLRVGDAPSFEDDLLYSELTVRQPVSADAVRLRFKRPYAKVRIQFYTNEPINSEEDNFDITNISFGPDPAAIVNKVYARGDMVISYPKSTDRCTGTARESFELQNLRDPQDALLFDDVTLTSTLGISSNTAVTAPIDNSEGFRLDNMPGTSLKAPQCKASGSSATDPTRAGEQPGRCYFYYPLPMGEKNPAFIMTACVDADIDPTSRTAVVPANFMQWKPNFLYTYIFKITAGGNIEFYDVQIEPWLYGGRQEEEWKNW